MIRALLLAGAVCVIATPALTQKGPSAAPGSEPDPVRGVTLDEFSETDSNMLTLGGITARIEAQANNDDTTTPVFVIQDASGEVLRFEGEPSFFSFLPASMRLANIDPSTPEPELIASSYTGGAHCCDRIQIAALSPDGTWQVHELGLFDGGYALEDADEDGFGELRVADQSFLYTFDCYACSFPPPRFFTVLNGVPLDVSNDPDLYATYQSELQRFERPSAMSGEPGRLAGWAGVEARLGRGEEALATLEQMNAASDTVYEICTDGGSVWECADADKREVGFVAFLRRHLVRQGYLPEAANGGGKG
jgi:hypothetical protein